MKIGKNGISFRRGCDILVFILASWAILCVAAETQAHAADTHRKLIVIVALNLSLDDLANTKLANIRKFADGAAVGLVSFQPEIKPNLEPMGHTKIDPCTGIIFNIGVLHSRILDDFRYKDATLECDYTLGTVLEQSGIHLSDLLRYSNKEKLIDRYNIQRDTQIEVTYLFEYSQIEFSSSDQLKITADKQFLMANLDEFIGYEMISNDSRTTVIMLFLDTLVSASTAAKAPMSLMLVSGPGFSHGLLSSSSTRRPGLVTNADLAPAILSWFGITIPSSMTGNSISTVQSEHPVEFLQHFQKKDTFIESHYWLLKVFVFVHVILAVGLFFLFIIHVPVFHKAIIYTAIAAILVHLSMLLVSPFYITDLSTYVPSLILIIAALTILAGIAKSIEWKIAAVSIFYIAAIALDQVLGAPMSRQSMIGYFPQAGARFYGLGNELMGYMVAAPVILCAIFHDKYFGAKKMKFIMFFLFAASAIVVGAPFLGANVGGLIACVFAYAYAWMSFSGAKINIKTFVVTVVGVAVIIVLLALLDLYIFKGHSTHLGRLAERISSNGWSEFIDIARRKINKNLWLLTVSAWSALFIGLGIISIGLLNFPSVSFRAFFAQRPCIRKGLTASIVGAAVAFAANDSGVIAAATCMIIPVFSVFALMLGERIREANRSVN